ncbi:MAG: HAMP domain-containing histidine kinase [Clostridia bacterium]|nr:HAMP domain-containing histidine kinase [Clostridia bacterium]
MESTITITNINFNDINIMIYILKIFLLGLCTYYTFSRLLNTKSILNMKFLFVILFTFIITVLHARLKYIYSSTNLILFILSLSILYSFITSNKIGYSILVTITSFSLNYIISFVSIVIEFIPNIIFGIQNDIISLLLIYTIHFIILFCLFKIRRFKNGFAFFQKNLENEYFDLLTLNISTIVLFVSILLSGNHSIDFLSNLLISFIVLGIIMFITIQRSLTLYYKHNLLVKDLNDTKAELEEKNEIIEKLEKDIIETGKINHSIAHKQRSLEYKLNELMLNSEIGNELDITDKINDVSKQLINISKVSELPKTDIVEIDDMLKFQQHECMKNNIDFDFQINGNIFHMVNTFIPKENLEILLADHIKNSIIAVNCSDNINKSILVRLGLIDNYYSLYVYDSGIEFELDTLSNLGKKPITTHADNGGTGFGFMNTFDTLKKYNASLIINELNPPCADNYTKSIVIKFDGKHEFKINSYRSNLVSSN